MLIDFKVDYINHLKLSSDVMVPKKVPILDMIDQSQQRVCPCFFRSLKFLKYWWLTPLKSFHTVRI